MALPVSSICLFPRLAKLRLTRNLPPPQLLHGKLAHISKKKSLKSGIYYQVTICRDCSDSNEYVDLGCFMDLESAILANDVYEVLSHRRTHVHLLTDEDMVFANELTVSRSWRNQIVEVNLMELMKENVSRSAINPAAPSSGNATSNDNDKRSKRKREAKHGPSAVYRRIMANRFLQLMDSNTNFIQALCCVPQAACDIYPVLVALTKMSVELNHNHHILPLPPAAVSSSSASASTTDSNASLVSARRYHRIKNLEAIITSAVACGLVSTSLIQLLSASCLEEDSNHITASNIDAGIDSTNNVDGSTCKDGGKPNEGSRSLTCVLRDSLGAESILSFAEVAAIKTAMIQAIASKKHIGIWGDQIRQLLRISHTAALKCELELHLPMWEPTGTQLTSSESKLQDVWETSLNHYNIVQELIGSLHAGAEVVANERSSRPIPTTSLLPTPAELGSTGSNSKDSNHINSLLDLARCTVVLTLNGLGTAVLLNLTFGLLPAAHLNSVFEHLVKWERIIRTTSVSNETAVVPFALYECIKLEVFSTFLEGEIKNAHTEVDIRPQLLLAAQMSAITLRMLNQEVGTNHRTSSSSKSTSSDQKQKTNQRVFPDSQRNRDSKTKHLHVADGTTSKQMFGIKKELALRINIGLMCLAVATGDLTCMGTVSLFETVVSAVHTLLNKLSQWLDMTEGGCGVLFAQTQLSLYKCVSMEDELARQLSGNTPEHANMKEMVHEISSLAEQVLRSLSTRFALSSMLLGLLTSHSVTPKAICLKSVQPSPSTMPHPRKRYRLSFDGDEGLNDRDDVTEIISLYSQSCRSISSFVNKGKKDASVAARRRKVHATLAKKNVSGAKVPGSTTNTSVSTTNPSNSSCSSSKGAMKKITQIHI